MSIGGATRVGGAREIKINTPGAQELDLIGTGLKNGLCKKKKSLQAKKIKKTYSTRDSLVVPYQSTDRAQGCLTSQFGWDAVLSPWYDRKTLLLRGFEPPCVQRNHGRENKKDIQHPRFPCSPLPKY